MASLSFLSPSSRRPKMSKNTALFSIIPPWLFRRSIATSADTTGENQSLRPRLHVSVPANAGPSQDLPTGAVMTHVKSYGTLRRESVSYLNQVPEEGPNEPDFDFEDGEIDLNLELEEMGLYRGSYTRLITLYSFVPFSCLLVFASLASIPILYPLPLQNTYPHIPYLPFPLPEILVSTSLWSLSHLLRQPLFVLSTLLVPTRLQPTYAEQTITALSTTLHVLTHNLLRLASFALLLLREQMDYPLPTWRDWAFRRVWWLGLGWGLGEVVVGVAQGYEGIGLYRDVLVGESKSDVERVLQGSERAQERRGRGENVRRGSELMFPSVDLVTETSVLLAEGGVADEGEGETRREREGCEPDHALRLRVDRDLDQLVALRDREELEEVYGTPIIKIPVFVSCLQRTNALILSTGLTLLLGSAYLRSPLSYPTYGPKQPIPRLFPPSLVSLSCSPSFSSTVLSAHVRTNVPLLITLPLILLLHTALSLLHTSLVLPRIGVHTSAYVGLLLGLGSLFGGLGVWDALR